MVSQVNPDFVRIRTACVKPGTELYEDYWQGTLILCSDDEKVQEIRLLITETKGVKTRLVSDHIVNLLQAVKGSLETDKEKMLAIIDGYLGLSEQERKLFQMARRTGRVVSLKEMRRISSEDKDAFLRLIDESTEEEWTEKMNALAGRYI